MPATTPAAVVRQLPISVLLTTFIFYLRWLFCLICSHCFWLLSVLAVTLSLITFCRAINRAISISFPLILFSNSRTWRCSATVWSLKSVTKEVTLQPSRASKAVVVISAQCSRSTVLNTPDSRCVDTSSLSYGNGCVRTLSFQPFGTLTVILFFNLASSTTSTGNADSTAALHSDGTSGQRRDS